MADTVELPNVDIFDPVMCARRWAQCATQQEINVYLNKQIDINRTVLKDTIDAQNAINAASKIKLDNHESRIISLESELAKLDKAQSDLNTAFQALQTDNNNFKSNVDLLLNQYQTTINLLQQNIDKISTSNEQLWNEVNILKSQFDPDKLNAAIAGYDSLLKETKAYTDSEAAKLKTQLDEAVTDLKNLNATLWQMMQDNNISWTSTMDSYRNQINADLEQQNQRIAAFIQNTDNVLQAQRIWLTNEIERVDKRIDSLTDEVDNRIDSLTDEVNKRIDSLTDEVAENKTASDEADTALSQRITQEVEQLNQTITDLEREQTLVIEGNRADSEKRDDDLKSLIDSNKTDTDSDYRTLKESDALQWVTINSILEAQNRINDNMETLKTYVDEQIKLVDADIASAKSDIAEQQAQIEIINKHLTNIDQNEGRVRVFAVINTEESIIPPYTTTFDEINFTIARIPLGLENKHYVRLGVSVFQDIAGVYSVPDISQGRFESMPLEFTLTNPDHDKDYFIECKFFREGWSVPARMESYYNSYTKIVKFVYHAPIKVTNE